MSDRQQPHVRKRGGVTVTRARMDLRWLYGPEIAHVRQGGSPSPRAVTVMATLAQLSAPVVETLRAAHLPSRDVPRPLRLLVAPLDPRLVVLVAARQGVAPDAVDALFKRATERHSPVDRFEARRAIDALIVTAQRELADALRAYCAVRARPVTARGLAALREALERSS